METTQAQSPEIEAISEEITALFKNVLAGLVERRDTAYANAVAALESEREDLGKESAAIEEAASNLKLILPAQERELRRESDRLLVEGKRAESAAKLAEADEAKRAPAAMSERQREISVRLEAIEREKQSIARRVFDVFYSEAQTVVRAAEAGFFLTLLDGLERASYAFQERTATPTNLLLESNRLAGLTADGNTVEWKAGNRWYSGRTR